MKLNTLISTILLGTALTTTANAATIQRYVDIEGKTYKLTEVKKDNYDYYADQLKSRLADLQTEQNLANFKTLVNEAAEFAQNAKRTVQESFVDQYDAQDNARERDMVSARSTQISKLITSLDTAAHQNELSAAKQAVLFNVASYL
ncbi:hypothetical protein QMO40_03770 [Mannheimia bovis]|uniref:OmpH family outer membrane protein n=1 Tax=Mannheimia indoligenes TaxID=3103145 RepID=A0ABU7ZD46_9PAST|nr:hypothetical protein [Mannheimia bovis]WHP47787.1 hypothetical protein QMO40_03770 [Mannheimia bovis]